MGFKKGGVFDDFNGKNWTRQNQNPKFTDNFHNMQDIRNFIRISQSKDLVLPKQEGIFQIFDRSDELNAINQKNKMIKLNQILKIRDTKAFHKHPPTLKQVRHHRLGYNQHLHHNN